MEVSRRSIAAALSVGLTANILRAVAAKAQFTEQEVRNGLSVVSSGDVTVDQAASGQQVVRVNGTPIEGDGIHSTSTGQVVVNDGSIVSSGDVSVSQSASGRQEVTVRTFPEYDGEPARVCNPGEVIANPDTGRVFYQADDCCWYAACANKCVDRGCEGDVCG